MPQLHAYTQNHRSHVLLSVPAYFVPTSSNNKISLHHSLHMGVFFSNFANRIRRSPCLRDLPSFLDLSDECDTPYAHITRAIAMQSALCIIPCFPLSHCFTASFLLDIGLRAPPPAQGTQGMPGSCPIPILNPESLSLHFAERHRELCQNSQLWQPTNRTDDDFLLFTCACGEMGIHSLRRFWFLAILADRYWNCCAATFDSRRLDLCLR